MGSNRTYVCYGAFRGWGAGFRGSVRGFAFRVLGFQECRLVGLEEIFGFRGFGVLVSKQ